MSPSRWFPVIKTTVAGRRAFTVLSSMTLRRNPYARALARLREMRGLTVEIETACVESAGTSADSDAVPEGLCETCDRVLALCGHLQYSCGSHFLGWSPVDVFEPLRSSVSTGSQPGLAWAQVREFVSRLADYRRSGCDWDAAERWLEESDLAAGPWSEPDVAAFRRWRMDLFSAVSRTHSCVLSSVLPPQTLARSRLWRQRPKRCTAWCQAPGILLRSPRWAPRCSGSATACFS